MTKADLLKDRTAFSGIDTETVAALAEFRDEMQKVLPDILVKFYAHIAKWPDLAGMFRDQSRIDHARSAQQAH